MKTRIENLIILLLGLCLGSVIGILSAPTKGSSVRSGLLYNLKLYQNKLRFFISKLGRDKNNVTNQAKNTGQDVITDVVTSSEKILEELDLLAKQLE